MSKAISEQVLLFIDSVKKSADFVEAMNKGEHENAASIFLSLADNAMDYSFDDDNKKLIKKFV